MTFTDARLYYLVILGGELADENVPKTDKTLRNISIYICTLQIPIKYVYID